MQATESVKEQLTSQFYFVYKGTGFALLQSGSEKNKSIKKQMVYNYAFTIIIIGRYVLIPTTVYLLVKKLQRIF